MKSRKKRTTFTLVDKAQALDLLDELEENGVAVLKIEDKSKKKKKKASRAEVKVFKSKQEIGDHYNVGKSTISGLVSLSDERKQNIRERAASIKKNHLVFRLFLLFLFCSSFAFGCIAEFIASSCQSGFFPFLEEPLYAWICKTRLAGVPLTVALVKENMLKLKDQYLEKFEDANDDVKNRIKYEELKNFKAETGWYLNFKRRYGLRSRGPREAEDGKISKQASSSRD